MEAQQMNLDVIANNLANVNTTGFKKSKIEFQDLLYQTNRPAGAEVGGGKKAYIANYMFPEGRTCSGDKKVLEKLCEIY